MPKMEAMKYFEEHFKGKNANTRSTYLRWFNRFMDYLDMTPEEFYEKGKMIKDGVLNGDIDERDENWIATQLNDYIEHLRQPDNHVREKPFKDGTISQILKAVNAFCKRNKLNVDTANLSKLEVKTYGKRMAVGDQIERMVARSSGRMFELRNTAVVMALKDNGARVSDLTQLTVESYHEAKENVAKMWKLAKMKGSPPPGFAVFEPLKALKTGAFMAVHLGPESTEAIDAYLGDRQTGPLFTKRVADGQGGYVVGDDGLSAGGFSMMLSRLAKEWPEISGHSLRKFHETKCGAGGLAPQLIALLNGVSTGRDSYVQNYYDGTLTRNYIKLYDELRIHKTVDEETQGELLELRAKVKELEDQDRQDVDEIAAMRAELADLHDIVKGLEHYRDIITSMEPTPELLRGITETMKAEEEGASTPELERRVRKLRGSQEEA